MFAIGKLLPWLLALGSLVVALTWLPPLSDGDLAVFDGISYAISVQRVESLAADSVGIVTYPNHLLHHVLAYVLVGPLRALGVEQPGFVAGRLLAGLGAAALALLVARQAGRRRGALGACFALAMLATRAVQLEAGAGETILPAVAAALWSLVLACLRPVPWWRLGFALTLALLFRQDNILVVPAVLLATIFGQRAGQPWRTLVALIAGVGAATLLAFAVAWWLGPMRHGFLEYLLGRGASGSWSLLDEVDVSAPQLHLSSFAWALVGRTGGLDEPQLLISAYYVGGLLLAGRLAGGGLWRDPFLAGALLVVVIRVPFFLWFEPENWEWQVLPLVLVAAAGARLAGGDQRISGARRVASVVLALAVTVGLLVVHGPATWALRRSTLRSAVEQAVARAGPDAEVHVIGLRTTIVLFSLDIPHMQLDVNHHPSLPFPPDYEGAIQAFLGRGRDNRPGPTLLIVDRFVRDGMPATRALDWRYDGLEELARDWGFVPLRWDGAVYAVLARPP